jgi:phosphatidylglycerol:prolipoprotein diacylglycerol transferase
VHPILFRLGSLNIYAYGFFVAVGFILGFVLSIRRGRQESIPDERIIDLIFLILLSALFWLTLSTIVSLPFRSSRYGKGGWSFTEDLSLRLRSHSGT